MVEARLSQRHLAQNILLILSNHKILHPVSILVCTFFHLYLAGKYGFYLASSIGSAPSPGTSSSSSSGGSPGASSPGTSSSPNSPDPILREKIEKMAAQFDIDPDEYCEELKQMNQEQFSKCQYIKKG